jgi:hypothetical protein
MKRVLMSTWLAASLCACGDSGVSRPVAALPVTAPPAATPKAACGPGSRPETGLQGRVSRTEHESGRAAEGYRCNAELVGSYVVPTVYGTVGGFKVEQYTDASGRRCAYYDTTLTYPTNAGTGEAGVNVMDMSDPTRPRVATRLTTPAMLTPHESLVVSQQAGVMAAVAGNAALYPGWVDVYDLKADCRAPVLKATLPLAVFGHESGMAPDGRTFYAASPGTPTITVIDLSNPALPVPLGVLPFYSHGLSLSDDGNRAYLAGVGLSGAACAYAISCDLPDTGQDWGLVILDVSDFQSRKANPQARVISRLAWSPISIPQNALPFTRDGKPYLLEIDEFSRASGVGAARIIDIADETKPKVISDIRLEVHNAEHAATVAGDPGAQFIGQGYAAHYCNLPTRVNPDIVACSMIVSGLRVFDIRDPAKPKEIAYYNPPLQPRITPVLEASGYALSSPSFVPERKEIWFSDIYSGFYVVRLTNGVW